MDYLTPVFSNRQISYYRLHSRPVPELNIYIASTPFSRNILNHPEVVGIQYTSRLQKAVTLALKFFPDRDRLQKIEPPSVSVVNFLRAGLNFGLREALHEAWGFNHHRSSFLTSQRERTPRGRWHIREDQYRKIEIPPHATFFIGDIVATGVTVENGLQIIYQLAKNRGRPVRNIVFFTIGCHKIEKVLRKYDRLLRSTFPEYDQTYLIYLEGKFHLADSKTQVRIKQQGTDLMRFPALLAPEFELEQFYKLSAPLERCVIYDGGSRAFNPALYYEDVRSYWEELSNLGQSGWTLREALKERWPAREYQLPYSRFAAAKKKSWKKIDRGLLEKMHSAYRKRWSDRFRKRAETSQTLVNLCHRRLRSLPRQ